MASGAGKGARVARRWVVILGGAACSLHVGDEAVVEILRRVVAHDLEGLDHGGDLDQPGDVAALADVEFHVGDLDAEDVVVVLLEAGAFLGDVGGPFAEGDDEVDALAGADALDAEHLGDVEDADAAALHVAAVEVAGGGAEFALVEEADAGEVVGDEGMAAGDEGEGTLGFADAGVAADHDADALHVEGGGVLGGGGGEFVVDAEGGGVDEVHRDRRHAEDGQVHLGGDGEHGVRGLVVAGEDEAGDAAAGHLAEDLDLLALGDGLEERHLGGAEDLDAFVREIFEEPGEGERGAVDRALLDEAVEAGAVGEELEFELVAVGRVEMGDGDAVDGFGGHGGGGEGMTNDE